VAQPPDRGRGGAPGRDPDELAAEAEALREQERELRAALAEDQARLNEAIEGRQQMERRLADAEQALVAAVEAIADRREGWPSWSVRSTPCDPLDRGGRRDRPARRRARRGAGPRGCAQEQYEAAAGASEADRGTAELDERHAERSAGRGDRVGCKELSDLERARREGAAPVEGARGRARARAARKDGAGALLASGGRVQGCSAASPRC
jgi:chromosome segregation protein